MKYIYFLSIFLFIVACNRTHHVKNAYQALDSKQFAVAVDLLQYDFNKSKLEEKKAEKAFLLGFAYEQMNRLEESGKWYQRAYKLGYGNKALLGYIRYIVWDERYDEAISLYETLQSRANRSSVYRKEIQQLKQAQLWKETDSTQLSFIKSADINSKYSDYCLTFISDDQMIFTSDRSSMLDNESYKWTGNAFSNVYTTSRNDDFVTPWMEEINSEDNDGIPALHPNNDIIVFVSCYTDYIDEDSKCKLLLLTKRGNEWSSSSVLNFVNEDFNYSSPHWNDKGDILFFSSDVKGGVGQYDLYGVSYNDENFGVPYNLGNRINTEGNEKFPTIQDDTLYYSSDHLTGMGGLDIFKCYLRYDSSWSAPQNMLPPINSGGDDFGYVVDELFQASSDYISKAYFSSSRKGGLGGDDIYEYFIKKKEKVEIEEEITNNVIHLVIKTTYPIYEDNGNGFQQIIGKKELSDVVVSLDAKNFSTDKKGLWLFNPNKDQDFELIFKKNNYFTQKLNISTKNLLFLNAQSDTTLFYEVLMIPIRENKEVVIKDIYYDYDQSNLRSDALPALNSLYDMLILNPELVIELSSHTDCRGEPAYNQSLSSRRAQSVVDFLMKKGISSSRLIAKGYGYTLPWIKCDCSECSEVDHQKNRRTSFKILGK